MPPSPSNQVPVPVPVWLDCDPGHDDAFAILMAAYHPGIKLLGISTVFGNASLEKTTLNASSILTAIGKHEQVPVYLGASKAQDRPSMHAPASIHGESGLDGTDLLPQPLKGPDTSVPAVAAMGAALTAQAPGTAYLVATGSLTNVAALFRARPELVGHIRGLSLMGGAFGGGFTDVPLATAGEPDRIGNYTPWAEFNIIADPEAAAEIFGDKELASKTTVIPLDLTHQVLATTDIQDALLRGEDAAGEGERQGEKQVDGKVDGKVDGDVDGESKIQTPAKGKTTLRQMLFELLMFFAKTYADVFGITAGPPLHDPVAVAVALLGTPNEIAFHDYDTKNKTVKYHERFAVSVETAGSYEDAVTGKTQTGRTVLTKLGPGSEGVRIPRAMDAAAFWKVIEECVQRADKANEGAVEGLAEKGTLQT